MANEHIDLDLQKLEVPTKNVRLPNGEVIIIKAPKLRELIRLGRLLIDWQKKANRVGKHPSDKETEEQFTMIEEFMASFEAVIPEIKGKDLEIDHIVAIAQLAQSLSTPAQIKELERRGITPQVPEGKTKKK